MENSSLKACPFCKEQIRKEAVKCRFCGEWLEQPVYPASNQPVAQDPSKAPLPAVTEKTAPAPESHAQPVADGISVVSAPENREEPPVKVEKWPVSEAPAKAMKPSQEELPPGPKFLDVAPKKLYLLGTGFLLLGVIMIVWMFGDVDFSRGDPDKISSLMAAMILKPILGAAALAWAVHGVFGKRKGYKFLVFAITWVVVMAWCSIKFREGLNASRTNSQAEHNQERAQLSILASNIADFPEQITNKDGLKVTGNADFDSAFQPMLELFREYSQSLDNLENEIGALQQRAVFDSSLFTNKAALEAEGRKRVESKQILEKYRQRLAPKIEAARQKYKLLNASKGNATLNTSEKLKRGAAKGFEEAMQKLTPQFEEMFSLRMKREDVELDFLKFLASVYGDYQVQKGVISFGTPKNLPTYNERLKRVNDVMNEQTAFVERQNASAQAGKAMLQQLGR